MVEAKVAIAKILMNYEFELDQSRTPVPLAYAIRRVVLAPLNGIHVKFGKI
jgi:hypothetical protein